MGQTVLNKNPPEGGFFIIEGAVSQNVFLPAPFFIAVRIPGFEVFEEAVKRGI
ncbi:hypothetical protein BN126_2164 [Cronobacter sakazakii 680]|nr:hypothetical protein BN126_2164 [Cronobacter sakazakii 680]